MRLLLVLSVLVCFVAVARGCSANVGTAIADAFGHVIRSGCWPKNIDATLFFKKDALTKEDAAAVMRNFIQKEPERVICENTYWFGWGYTVKCTRADYAGVSCGHGSRELVYHLNRYIWREQASRDTRH